MGYYECALTDLGFECPTTRVSIADISGMDNHTPGQCFQHRGVTGYPDVPTSFSDEMPGVSVICIAADLPSGANELTEEQFVAKLIADYGWPIGTTMGADGLPHGPPITDSTFYRVNI
jgi:hypothetical protein